MTGLEIALIGVGLAVILAGIGSAIGVGVTAQVANGVMSEEPELFGRVLLLTALPGTQGIYGFLVGFLVIMKLGLIGTTTGIPLFKTLTVGQGWQLFLSCLPIAFAGIFSAIHQGRVCATGVEMTAKQPGGAGKAMVLAVFVEFYAVLGLLASILLIYRNW
ncbi:MAG TPA: V-type ATP synthase subunit K [Candidatus Latescibacteria bacterium]|nr:V-type ATP synthase subunit K [Candidatus Latescibacterota bacterium]